MLTMKDEVKEALSVLVGKPLWASGHSAGLEWFQFGLRREVTGIRGNVKDVGEYALHVQCAWRITRQDRVVAASGDLHEASEQDSGESQRTLTRLDDRLQQLFKADTVQFAVERIEVRDAGAFSITLADGFALDVLPDDSTDDEQWRLFKPYSEGDHFVVTGAGLAS